MDDIVILLDNNENIIDGSDEEQAIDKIRIIHFTDDNKVDVKTIDATPENIEKFQMHRSGGFAKGQRKGDKGVGIIWITKGGKRIPIMPKGSSGMRYNVLMGSRDSGILKMKRTASLLHGYGANKDDSLNIALGKEGYLLGQHASRFFGGSSKLPKGRWQVGYGLPGRNRSSVLRGKNAFLYKVTTAPSSMGVMSYKIKRISGKRSRGGGRKLRSQMGWKKRIRMGCT